MFQLCLKLHIFYIEILSLLKYFFAICYLHFISYYMIFICPNTFFMDLDNEVSLIGVNSFLMPISCYFLGFVRLNSSNWETYTKLIYIIFVLIISYSIKGFFYQWAIVPNIVPFIVNSMLIILAFLSVNQFYYKKKLMV